jgi:hypothetical protein
MKRLIESPDTLVKDGVSYPYGGSGGVAYNLSFITWFEGGIISTVPDNGHYLLRTRIEQIQYGPSTLDKQKLAYVGEFTVGTDEFNKWLSSKITSGGSYLHGDAGRVFLQPKVVSVWKHGAFMPSYQWLPELMHSAGLNINEFTFELPYVINSTDPVFLSWNQWKTALETGNRKFSKEGVPEEVLAINKELAEIIPQYHLATPEDKPALKAKIDDLEQKRAKLLGTKYERTGKAAAGSMQTQAAATKAGYATPAEYRARTTVGDSLADRLVNKLLS